MTRADFYILTDPDPAARYPFACRLTEKIFRLGHRVHIHTDDKESACHMDDLLWSFTPESFVPHELAESASSSHPVTIGWAGTPLTCDDIMINLGREVPPFFSRFLRVAEVATQDKPALALAREHFRFYRDRGYQTRTHNIG